MLNQPSVITTWVGVTLRAVCITAGVQVRNESEVVSCYRSATAAERKKNVFLLCKSSVLGAVEAHGPWQSSSVLTAVQSRSNIWDFPLRRQLCKRKTETRHNGQTVIHQHLDFEAETHPSGGHKLNSRGANVTRRTMGQEKGGSHFDSISQESVWQVLAHTCALG